MQKIQIHFHSNAHKSRFVKENGFSKAEILAETPASITVIDEGYNFIENSNVYSISKIEG